MEIKIGFEALKKMTIQEIMDLEDSLQDLKIAKLGNEAEDEIRRLDE